MTTVDLLVPELNAHDAVGNHVLFQRDLLVEMGADVRLVTQMPSSLDEPFILIPKWSPGADVVIVQHSIGSLVAEAVIETQTSMVLNYHNITPFEFVEPWDSERIAALRLGRTQLDEMLPLTSRAIADSAYNASELLTAGYLEVVVSPVLRRSSVGVVERVLNPAAPLVLFVGRVAPNKCYQDLVGAFALIADEVSGARLVLVGAFDFDSYVHAVRRYAYYLGVDHVVELVGEVSDSILAEWYGRADVFVCLSEHEGFCVPVLEAMEAGVPVIAFRAAALPETVADAALILADKAPATVAGAVRRVLGDTELNAFLVKRGQERAAAFDLSVAREQMREALTPVLNRDTEVL